MCVCACAARTRKKGAKTASTRVRLFKQASERAIALPARRLVVARLQSTVVACTHTASVCVSVAGRSARRARAHRLCIGKARTQVRRASALSDWWSSRTLELCSARTAREPVWSSSTAGWPAANAVQRTIQLSAVRTTPRRRIGARRSGRRVLVNKCLHTARADDDSSRRRPISASRIVVAARA